MVARYLIGDVFERLAELEDASVDLVLTSPPFLALRSYLPDDHPDKDKEIGQEQTPSDFVDVLLELTAEWRRILAPHGSLCLELGDTFAGSGGSGGDYNKDKGKRGGQNHFRGSAYRGNRNSASQQLKTGIREPGSNAGGLGWPLPKSLALIPESYRFALVYGYNPHHGSRFEKLSPAGQWRARNVVRWVRPNPPVGALGDKFRPASSDMIVACLSGNRFFDLTAVRAPFKTENVSEHDGAPPLDYWELSTAQYQDAHYAVWPEKLCEIPIKSMSPQKVCRDCGEPSRRILEKTDEYEAFRAGKNKGDFEPTRWDLGVGGGRNRGWDSSVGGDEAARAQKWVTVGWSDCGHDDWRRGVVLDPFAGSGTTLKIAEGHGRDSIGIDLDERNAELAVERVGPLFMSVEGRDHAS